jgi:hypothetical protein
MTRIITLVTLFTMAPLLVRADVRVDRRTETTITAARMPIPRDALVQDLSIVVKGDRMMKTVGRFSAELIDLRERKVYQFDLRQKNYTVRTFADLQSKRADFQRSDAVPSDELRETQEKALRQDPATVAREMRAFIDRFEITGGPTGRRQTMNGFDAQEVVTTITFGESPEMPGGMRNTITTWTAHIPAMDEIEKFEARYASMRGEPAPTALMRDSAALEAAAVNNPLLGELIAKTRVDDSVKGTAVLTVMNIGPASDAPPGGADVKSQPGLLGALAREAGKSFGFGLGRRKEQAEQPAASPVTPMSTRIEIVRVSTTVADDEVSIPPGFREVRARR